MENKPIGVVIEVNGEHSIVGMYDDINDTDYLWKGDILSGPKSGSYLTINQNNIKIVTTVESERVLDEKNRISNDIFDNTFTKNSIKRIITLKTKGVIKKDAFLVTSRYVPMIGNQVTITTKDELDLIYGIDDDNTIEIGSSLLESYPIKLPINNFFASHIGIFGNTGSGKSNTLHKVYLELFKTPYYEQIKKHSKFYLIDFNGEYSLENQFNIKSDDLNILKINTRTSKGTDKISIIKKYFFDTDVLSALFDARSATQVPFIKSAMIQFDDILKNNNKFGEIEIGLFKKLLIDVKYVSKDSYENWVDEAQKLCKNSTYLPKLKELCIKNYFDNTKAHVPGSDEDLIVDNKISEKGMEVLCIKQIEKELNDEYSNLSDFKKLIVFFNFQMIYETAWKKIEAKFIAPLLKRIETSMISLEKVIELVDDIDDKYKMFNIISLVNANTDTKRLIPMLLSKMIYDRHKEKIVNETVDITTHLIIDEAHNILSQSTKSLGDEWQDYRLSIFEEIIKEGRKFGFYLTLASQRPADISQTIISQLHNYIIHRLINENDINMLKNTVTTLEQNSFSKITTLGQGEAIITGTALNMPVLVKVNKEDIIRPNSDDFNLINIWSM